MSELTLTELFGVLEVIPVQGQELVDGMVGPVVDSGQDVSDISSRIHACGFSCTHNGKQTRLFSSPLSRASKKPTVSALSQPSEFSLTLSIIQRNTPIIKGNDEFGTIGSANTESHPSSLDSKTSVAYPEPYSISLEI